MALPSSAEKEIVKKATNSLPRYVTVKRGTREEAARSGRLYKLDDFDLAHLLGEGGFGKVYLARHRSYEWLVALKVLSKFEVVSKGMEGLLKREIEIHSALDHPNILRFYGYFHDEHNI